MIKFSIIIYFVTNWKKKEKDIEWYIKKKNIFKYNLINKKKKESKKNNLKKFFFFFKVLFIYIY
jgi:hypothetical protein